MKRFDSYLEMINRRLTALLPVCTYDAPDVCDAMRYSLDGGGKRIRPVLLLESCRLCGGDVADALDFACALEMIHTYSLVHDDLPCMDDDDMRRGKPACHIAFGEATAVLAGDALLTQAFAAAANSEAAKKTPARALEAIALLSKYAGAEGMIGGQVVDLQSEGKTIALSRLQTMDSLKTGALMRAACEIGAVLAGADNEKRAALVRYAEALGQAFQIVDDILDVTSDVQTLGKPIGSDAELQKSTYVSLLGLDRAKAAAKDCTAAAIDALNVFGADAAFLRSLAENLMTRTS
jgi:geranylgeranyl diphosphate synthase type II